MFEVDGITYIENFIDDSQVLLDELSKNIEWDTRMKARLTASFGAAYNYSQITYPDKKMPRKIVELCEKIESRFGFLPNNCLLNFYPNGRSRMGFHSDQTDILAENTGIAIISLGAERVLKFRAIGNGTQMFDYALNAGSLIYMTQEIQRDFQHSIPKAETENARMSLAFRKIK